MAHVSKKQQVENLLNDIKAYTTKDNVDWVIPLLEWNKEKIQLIVSAEQKKKAVMEAKRQGKTPPSPMPIKRGEIWQAKLGHNVGSEQNKSRPVLIVQNDINNKRSTNVIVAPLSKVENRNNTSTQMTQEELEKIKLKIRPTEVFLEKDCVAKNEKPLDLPSILLCQNVRDLSKERLEHRITFIDDTELWEKINKALLFTLGIGI